MICSLSEYGGVALRRVELAGAACSELVDGVVQLRPEDAMVEAVLHGWRGDAGGRGLGVVTLEPRGCAGGPRRASGTVGATFSGVHQRVTVAVGTRRHG